MSIQAVAFILDTDVPEVAAKMLLVCLANAHNQETGLCCPSVNRLADESSMSRRSVQRWLKWLADEGYIEVVERNENGRQQANEYRISGFYRGAKLTPPTKSRGVTSDAGEGDTVDTLGGDTADAPLKKPEENRKNEREQASTRVSFDVIWNVYPRRPMTNRSEAEAEYDRLSDEETHRLAIAVQRYGQWHIEDAAARKESPEAALEFRMGLAKWIRSGAWVDALTVPLKSDPVPANHDGLVVLASDHPDFLAVERMHGKKLYVGDSGKRTFRIEEVEQARAANTQVGVA